MNLRSRFHLAARPLALGLFMAALLMAAAACGSDSPDGATGGGTPTATANIPTVPAVTPSPTVAPTTQPTATPVPPTAAPTATPVTAPASSLPVTVTDVNGNEVTITDISRIVSLNGDFTEIIYALGLGDNLAAVDTSATYPPEAHDKPSIGYQRALSAEGILAIGPTVIIGSTSAGPPDVVDQIRQAGVPVLIIETPPTIDGAAEKVRRIAEALGVADKGEELATKLEADVAEAKALAAQATGDPPVAIFVYMRGLDTLMIAGNGDLSADMFAAAGAISGGVQAGINGFAPLTAEALVTAAPDYIVAFDSGLESVGGIDGFLQIPGVAQTPAGQNRAVITFDGLYFSGGGPRTGQALMELVLALHPELEGK